MRIYLYCNSPATAQNGQMGFVHEEGNPLPKERGHRFRKIKTTSEFAFAMEFTSLAEAMKFNEKILGNICIVFLRLDLD
jgi:hypothetical protein